MTSLKAINLTLLILFFSNAGMKAQGSFQVIVEPPPAGFFRVEGLISNKNDDLALLLHKLSADYGISFYKMDTQNGVIGGTKIKFPNDVNPFATLNFSYLGNQVISTIYFIHLQSPYFRKTLVSLDLTTGECWGVLTPILRTT